MGLWPKETLEQQPGSLTPTVEALKQVFEESQGRAPVVDRKLAPLLDCHTSTRSTLHRGV